MRNRAAGLLRAMRACGDSDVVARMRHDPNLHRPPGRGGPGASGGFQRALFRGLRGPFCIDSDNDATVTIGEFGPWIPTPTRSRSREPLAGMNSQLGGPGSGPAMSLQHSSGALLPGAHRRNGSPPTPMGRRG